MAAIAGLADPVDRVSQSCDDSGAGAAQVRYLQSTHFAPDRIADALVLFDCAPRIPVASDTSLQGEPQ